MNTLLKSAKIIDKESRFHNRVMDIHIADGTIINIAENIEAGDNVETISLDNLHVSRGWSDNSVCFGEPGYEERETITNGLKTAAKSGFTGVAVQPDTFPVTDTGSGIGFLKSKATGNAVDLYPLGALTLGSKGEKLAELYDMKNTGAVAFGDYKTPVSNPEILKIALQYTQSFDGLVCAFPQDNKIAASGMVNEHIAATKLGLKSIPALAETLQITRDIAILEYTGGKLHIPTISTATSVELIKKAKEKGLHISCSVAIHNLFFNDEVLYEFDSRFKVMPPLRSEDDRLALINGLKNGSIDFVTADHCPVNIEHKKTAFNDAMYGTIGLESAFGALQQVLGMEKSIELLTKSKALFGIPSSPVKKEERANLSLFNPDEEFIFEEKDIFSTSKNTAFSAVKLKGKAYGIFNAGQAVLNT